ncbi:potassium-transporting ATPase subunit F [Lentibacillus halophilus]
MTTLLFVVGIAVTCYLLCVLLNPEKF